MKIDVQWLSEEKRVIQIVYHANWTWEDYEAHRKVSKTLMRQVPYNVVILMEYDRDAGLLPANALRNLGHAIEEAEPNHGRIVIIAPSQFWRVVIVLLKRLLPNSLLKNTYIVPSRQVAFTLIDEYLANSKVVYE